jgi:hypothetical protein
VWCCPGEASSPQRGTAHRPPRSSEPLAPRSSIFFQHASGASKVTADARSARGTSAPSPPGLRRAHALRCRVVHAGERTCGCVVDTARDPWWSLRTAKVRSGTSGTSALRNQRHQRGKKRSARTARRGRAVRTAPTLCASSTRPAHGSCSCASPWIDQEELPQFLLDCALPHFHTDFLTG